MTAGVPLKLKDSDHPVELQKFDTTGGVSSDQNYLAYQASLYLADQDSNNTGRLSTVSDASNQYYSNRGVGTYVNTFFDSAIGTSSGSGGLYSITTLGTLLSQNSFYENNTDSDVRRLIYLDSDASMGYTQTDGGVDTVIPQLKIKEMDSDTENRLVDRINSYIYTNDYPGTYKLSSSTSINNYSIEKLVFNDTRADNTTVPYYLHKRTSMGSLTTPSTARPLAIKRSNGDSGDYQGLQEMTDRQIQQSLGCASKNRTAAQNGGIGSYTLLSSAQGTPASTGKSGTWVSKGTATDTRQVIEDATYTRSKTSTYLRQKNSTYSQQYTRDRASTFTQDFTGNYSRNFQDTYTKTRTSIYSPGFVGDFQGNYTRERDQNFTRTSTRTSTYTRDSNRDRNTNFQRTQLYAGNFARNFVGDYVGTATVSINAGQVATPIGGLVVGNHSSISNSSWPSTDMYQRVTLPNGSIGRFYCRAFQDTLMPGSSAIEARIVGVQFFLSTDSSSGAIHNSNSYPSLGTNMHTDWVHWLYWFGNGQYQLGNSYTDGVWQPYIIQAFINPLLSTYSGTQTGVENSASLGSQANSKDFLGNYSGAFARNFSRTVNYTGDFAGDFQGNYSRTLYFKGNYTGDFTGNYTRQSSRTREDSFARDFAGDFQGNYVRTSSRNFTRDRNTQFQRTRAESFAGDFTGDFSRNYHGDFTGNYQGTAVVTLSATEAVTNLGGLTYHTRNIQYGSGPGTLPAYYYYTGRVDNGQRLMRFYVVSQFLGGPQGPASQPGGPPLYSFSAYMAENSNTGAISSGDVANSADNDPNVASQILFTRLQSTSGSGRTTATVGSGQANYTRDRNTNPLKNSTRDSNRNRAVSYEGNYTGDFAGNYSRNFVGNYLRDSNRTITSSYIGAQEFARDFAGDFVGNYARDFTRTSSRTIGANYVGNYTGNYQRSFLGNYSRNFAGNYLGTNIGSSNTNIETYTLYVRTA